MFYKNLVDDTGIITNYHRIASLSANFPTVNFIAVINSYVSKASILLGEQPVHVTLVSVPFSVIGANTTRSIENWIVSTSATQFLGGDLQQDPSTDPLTFAKERQWEIIKAIRAQRIAAIDLDQSQANIDLATKAIRDTSLTLKTAIQNATTIDEVSLITWPN